ncbi:MAG: hypothetical protein HOW73_24465 [Polyangiaceae bacterium]|nr:hypothetical protein [Polyangiaceae bacterium]
MTSIMRAMPAVRLCITAAGAGLVVLSAGVGWAQDEPPVEPPKEEPTDPSRVRESDAVRAQALFDEALALGDQGRWADACPKFRESLAADPGVGTLLNVASCSAREGKTLVALREYRRALELNESTKDPERKKTVEVQVRQALKDLGARVGSLRVAVSPATAAAKVTVDGAAVDGLDKPLDLEVGQHTLSVEAAGFRASQQSVAIVGGQTASIAVALEPTEKPVQPAPTPAASHRLATAGWITGLVGAGGLTTGAVLVALAADRAGAIRDECGADAEPPNCPLGDANVANDLASEGEALANGGYAALGIGGAAVIAGVGMLIIDAVSSDTPDVRVSFDIEPGRGMLEIGGRF